MKLILGNHLKNLTLFNFIFFWFNVKVQLEPVQIQENHVDCSQPYIFLYFSCQSLDTG